MGVDKGAVLVELHLPRAEVKRGLTYYLALMHVETAGHGRFLRVTVDGLQELCWILPGYTWTNQVALAQMAGVCDCGNVTLRRGR
jgi:hypothetical protein